MKFYRVIVENIEKDTNEAVIVTLGTMAQDSPYFKYRSGQYLTFKHEFEGEELRRSYSICASEYDEKLKVGVKRLEGGVFSSFMNNTLAIGDELFVMAPQGNFTIDDQVVGAHVLMIAAGSGITPIISHIETLFERNDQVKVSLIYGNKSPHSIMFRERIEALKNRYISRFSIVHVLSSSPQDIALFSGRVTRESCEKIVKNWIRKTDISNAFICGPEEMIQNASLALQSLGLKKSQIRYELFETTRRTNGTAKRAATHAKEIELTVILDGSSYHLSMSKGQTVLEVARENKLDAPFSCEGGICSTCRCKVLEGEGDMNVNHALEDYEIEAGYALSCQLIPRGNRLIISYDDRH